MPISSCPAPGSLGGYGEKNTQYLYSVIRMFTYIYLYIYICIYIYNNIIYLYIWLYNMNQSETYVFSLSFSCVFTIMVVKSTISHLFSDVAVSHKTTNTTSVEVFKSILLIVHLQELLSSASQDVRNHSLKQEKHGVYFVVPVKCGASQLCHRISNRDHGWQKRSVDSKSQVKHVLFLSFQCWHLRSTTSTSCCFLSSWTRSLSSHKLEQTFYQMANLGIGRWNDWYVGNCNKTHWWTSLHAVASFRFSLAALGTFPPAWRGVAREEPWAIAVSKMKEFFIERKQGTWKKNWTHKLINKTTEKMVAKMMTNLFPFCVLSRSFGCISIWVNLADRNQMTAKHVKHAKSLKAEKYTHSNTWFFPIRPR